MFKQLRKKLTMFNAIILIIFMLSFVLTLYGIINIVLERSASVALNIAIEKLKISQNRPLEIFGLLPENVGEMLKSNSLHEFIEVDYIIWNENLKISKINNVNEETLKVCHNYAKESLEDKRDTKYNLYINGMPYRIVTSFYEKNGKSYVAQVYQSRVIEVVILNQILKTLLFIGILGIVILVPISNILAGKSLKPVKETFENQKNFIADASHELRNPLTVIQTNLDVVMCKPNETIETNERWLNNIYSETETMSKLVKDLLFLAQADNKQVQLEKIDFNISYLCKEISEYLQPIVNNKNINLKTEIKENIIYYGDQNKIRQLVRIFLDNAIKYTPKGEVEIILKDDKENIYLIIRDTGEGIDEQNIRNIFNRFYRADKARSRAEGGTGLGLSIATWIVDVHKGKIKVDSTLNKGSIFTIVLPKKI